MFRSAVLTQSTSILTKDSVRLEFPARVLVRLLAKGHLHAEEFRCLDLTSRNRVRQVLLQSCLESLKGGWS